MYSVAEHSVSDESLAGAVYAIARAAAALDVRPGSAGAGVVDSESALDTLTSLAQALGQAPATPADRDALLLLRAARGDLLAEQLARQRSMLATVTRQTTALRQAASVDELVEAIPMAVSDLGYERALFSWIDGEKWVPRSSYTVSGPEEAREMLAVGGPPYVSVRGLLEVDVVRARRSLLVLDATDHPRVHPTIGPVNRSVTYVAAPVIARDRVAGIVHLDRNRETGLTDEFDRDLLTYFCDSVGVTLERLLDRSDAQPSAPVVGPWLDQLTEREREVLALVATGLTNAQIAGRLYLSQETVKSHVKKLMRKLGVRNRSQAAAMFHTTPAA